MLYVYTDESTQYDSTWYRGVNNTEWPAPQLILRKEKQFP